MTDSKHTPGLWAVAPVSGTRLPFQHFLVSAISATLGGFPVCEITADKDDHAEAAANARLIGSAPDLLKQLKRAISCIECCGGGLERSMIPAMQAAIEEAEGKNQPC